MNDATRSLIDDRKPALATSSAATNHRVILGVSIGVVMLSALLALGDRPGQVLIPIINQPLPPLCALKTYTGLDCPGCGLTRSFICAGHGRWQQAWHFNPAGPVWFALIAAQVPWQTIQLRRLATHRRAIELGWWGQGLLWFAVSTLIGQWVVRQLGWL